MKNKSTHPVDESKLITEPIVSLRGHLPNWYNFGSVEITRDLHNEQGYIVWAITAYISMQVTEIWTNWNWCRDQRQSIDPELLLAVEPQWWCLPIELKPGGYIIYNIHEHE